MTCNSVPMCSLEHLNSGTTKKNKHFVSPLDISICSGAGLLLSDEKAVSPSL